MAPSVVLKTISNYRFKTKDIQLAFQHLDAGRFTQCLDDFKAILHVCPDSLPNILIPLYKLISIHHQPEKLTLIAVELYIANQLYSQAFDELEHLYELYPNTSEIYGLFSKLYFLQIYQTKIAALFEDAFATEIFYPDIIAILNHFYTQEQALTKHIALTEYMLKKEPTNLTIKKTLADLYFKNNMPFKSAEHYFNLGQLSSDLALESLSYLEKIVQTLPDEPCLYPQIIKTSFKSGHPLFSLPYIQRYYLFDQDSTHASLDFLHDILDIYPEHADSMFLLSEILIHNNDLTKGVFILDQLFTSNPSDHIEKIEMRLKTLLKHFPDQACGLLLQCHIFIFKRQFDQAIHTLETVIDLPYPELSDLQKHFETISDQSPQLSQYCHYLELKFNFYQGNYSTFLQQSNQFYQGDLEFDVRLLEIHCYIKQKNYPQAKQLLLNALHFYSTESKLHHLLRDFQDHLLQIELSKYTSSQLQEPSHYFKFGLLLLRKGELKKAVSYFQNITPDEPLYPQSQILIGRCFTELGRYDFALNIFKRVLTTLNPHEKTLSNQTRYLMGLNFIHSGKIYKGISILEDIIEFDISFHSIDPLLNLYKGRSFNEHQSMLLVGCFHFQENTLRAFSIPYHDSSSNTSPHQDMGLAHIHNNHGVSLVLQKNFSSAKTEFELALQLNSSLSVIYNNLAYLAICNKEYNLAHDYLCSGLNIDQNLDTLYINRGILMMLENNEAAAIKSFQKALQLSSKNSIAHILLGDLYFKQGFVKLAFQYWLHLQPFSAFDYLLQRRFHYLKFDSMMLSDWIKMDIESISAVIQDTTVSEYELPNGPEGMLFELS